MIAGAAGPTHLLTADDVGSTLLVVETAADVAGSSSSPSPLTGVVAAAGGMVPVPVNQSQPTLSGVAEQGQTLVASSGAWSGQPTSYSYQWERCGVGCAPIPGATGQSYTVTGGDVGEALAVLATASNSGGSGVAAASGRTALVTATSSVSLVVAPGSPLTNQTVTMVATISSSSANADPSGSVTFLDGDSSISGCANQAFRSASQNVTLICQSSLAAGPQRLSAVYAPAPGLLVAGAATELTVDVGRDSTSTALAVTRRVSRSGRALYTATVVLPVSNSGPMNPTGSVGFFDRGRPIRACRSRPLRWLTASCVVRYRAAGRHEISARYSGDANFGASRSAARLVRIVTGSSGPAVFGFIGSVLQWQFHYHPRYTQVTLLRAVWPGPWHDDRARMRRQRLCVHAALDPGGPVLHRSGAGVRTAPSPGGDADQREHDPAALGGQVLLVHGPSPPRAADRHLLSGGRRISAGGRLLRPSPGPRRLPRLRGPG